MEEYFNYEIKRENDLVIFKITEPRFDSQIAGLVKGELTILLNTEDVRKLIFDLSDVEYCDSSGLSAILLAFRMLRSNNGKLIIAAAQKSVQILIEISQLDKVLTLTDTVEAAKSLINTI